MEYIILFIWLAIGFSSWYFLEKNDYNNEVDYTTFVFALLMSWAGVINLLVFVLKLLFETKPDNIYR